MCFEFQLPGFVAVHHHTCIFQLITQLRDSAKKQFFFILRRKRKRKRKLMIMIMITKYNGFQNILVKQKYTSYPRWPYMKLYPHPGPFSKYLSIKCTLHTTSLNNLVPFMYFFFGHITSYGIPV